MKQLTLIANKNGTDKGTQFRECHGYTEIYEDYIKKYVGKHPKILEIGIENGGSLRMWNDYFAGDCEIYAIDILSEKKQYETENTHIFIMDQSSREDWKNFKSQFPNNGKDFFDIIIDDGSHVIPHQIVTLSELCDSVEKNDGIYILEDLHTNVCHDERYLCGGTFTDTPLFTLAFKEYNSFLTNEENEFLFSKLKDFIFYSFHNDKGDFKNSSMTSILTFK